MMSLFGRTKAVAAIDPDAPVHEFDRDRPGARGARARRALTEPTPIGRAVTHSGVRVAKIGDGACAMVLRGQVCWKAWDDLRHPGSAAWPESPPRTFATARELQRLTAEGLAEPLGSDALFEALRHASRADLTLNVSVRHRAVRGDWTGRLSQLDCVNGRASAQGTGIRLCWREDLPGQSVWLERRADARRLTHRLLMFAPDGELRLIVESFGDGARGESCAWRNAVEIQRGGRPGPAC